MQQQIIKGILVGIGNTLKSQPMYAPLGQNKPRDKITKMVLLAQNVLTSLTISDYVTNARWQILSISREHTLNVRQCIPPTEYTAKSEYI